MNSVSEKIDIRILRLLGLTDVFDLDYDTYSTLLREAIVSGAGKFPQEELALLSNERKRIRSKKGRFRPRPKKITASSVATTKFLNPSVQPISTPLIAPSLGGVQQPTIQPVNLAPLQAPLESIKQLLQAFLDHRKGVRDDERKSYENERRVKKEEGLENVKKGMQQVSAAVKNFVSPFQNIMERIQRFIFFTLLGRAFTQLIDWFGNPKNREKVETLRRFIKDWWPTLLGAFVLFFTPFGRFVRGVLRIVGGLTGKLVGAIPRIGNAIKGLSRVLLNPWVAGAAAVAGTAVVANQLATRREEESQTQVVVPDQTGENLGSSGMTPISPFRFIQGAARGGPIMNGYFGINNNTGQRISGFGPDTQLIAAQPGEIVINKATVDAVGADTFLALNRYHGGSSANQPRFGKLFNTGGQVGAPPTYGQNLKYRSPIVGYPNYQQPKDRYGSFYAKIYKLAKSFGDPFPEVTAAQAAEESGYGTSNLAKKANNLFGQDAPSGSLGYKYFDPVEQREHNAMMFKSLAESVAYRVRKWKKYYGNAKTPEQAIINISKSGYNPHAPYPGKIIALMREQGVDPSLPSPIKPFSSAKVSKKESGENQKRPWYDLFGWFGGAAAVNKKKKGDTTQIQKKKGGGLLTQITKDYGIPIKGMGVDTQFNPYLNAALQPGEELFKYVLTKKASDRGLGDTLLSIADSLQSGLDSGSDVALLEKKVTKPQITPLPIEGNSTTTLPAIELGSGKMIGGTISSGTRVPSFEIRSPKAMGQISVNKNIYGIRESFTNYMHGVSG